MGILLPLVMVSLGGALVISAVRIRHRARRGAVALVAVGGAALVILAVLPVLDLATGYTVVSLH